MFRAVARPMPRRSRPMCRKNRRSSLATAARATWRGIAESGVKERRSRAWSENSARSWGSMRRRPRGWGSEKPFPSEATTPSRISTRVGAPGQYRMRGSIFEIYLRPFVYPDRTEPGAPTLVEIRDGVVASLGNGFSEPQPRGLLRIDPQLLAEFSDQARERRSFTPLSAIPRHVALAAVASEDRRFFRHMGLDLLGIGRATARNMRAGSLVEGGSTISQQLAKNVFLSRRRTLTRKLHEALLALLIELRYSKEQILEFYLNQIYLGQRGSWSVCGVEEGALYYFNKHAKELTPGEGALIAGIIPAPNRISPYRDPESAIARRNQVLSDMVECGWISKE